MDEPPVYGGPPMGYRPMGFRMGFAGGFGGGFGRRPMGFGRRF
jgi:hypothetical protein